MLFVFIIYPTVQELAWESKTFDFINKIKIIPLSNSKGSISNK